MLKPMLASALFAGLIAGLFAAGLQQAFLVPLIQQAELYENGQIVHFAGAEVAHDHAAEHDHGAAADHDHDGAGDDDILRTLKSIGTMIMSTCGFALLLVAGFALAEQRGLARVDLRTGLMFGLAIFAATQLMPAMGLPPEPPGASAADLADRQLWWIATAVATLGGLAVIAWGGIPAKAAGVLLIAAPHLWGAPHLEEYSGVVPPELSALFAARSIGMWAMAMAILGAVAGHLWSRETAS